MSVWSSLIFNAGDAVSTFVSGLNYRIPDRDGEIVYKNNRYKSVLVHIAKRTAMATLEQSLNRILPKFKRGVENKLHDFVLKQEKANYETLIQNREKQSENWGRVFDDAGHVILARDKYGTLIKESLMLYYKDTKKHTVTDFDNYNTKFTHTYETDIVCHIDLAPKVSTSSTKNVVLTQVQGRDYTRKELVSGGDLTFTINGNIVSDDIGVYPTEKVKKFVQIMQYNGILSVNFMVFEQLEVKRVIVKDWSLNEQEYKNVQPYTFSCVAVESDEEVKVSQDTIATINKEIQTSPLDSWYSMILKDKLSEIIVNSAASVTEQVAGKSLDALTTNI